MSYPKGWAEEHPLDNSGGEASQIYKREAKEELYVKRANYVQETATRAKQFVSAMLIRFSLDLPENMRDRFNRVIYDVRKEAALRTFQEDAYMNPFSLNFTIKKESMKTIEELKNEIAELENIRTGLSSDIDLLNSKNQNAQAQRDRVTAKIDGLKWALNEGEDVQDSKA